MCLRRKAAPTLATHLCHIFPEQSKAVYGCTPQPTYFVFKHVHPYHKLANNHIYGCTQPIYGCTPQRTYLIRVNLYTNDNSYGYTLDSCVHMQLRGRMCAFMCCQQHPDMCFTFANTIVFGRGRAPRSTRRDLIW